MSNEIYYPETIGERIKYRRIELGYSQKYLATILGYKSKTTINKIEMGINNISGPKLVNMARALNTTLDFLTGKTDYSSNNDDESSRQDAFFFTQNKFDSNIYSVCKKVACLNPSTISFEIISMLVSPENEFTEEQLTSIRDFIRFIASKKPL